MTSEPVDTRPPWPAETLTLPGRTLQVRRAVSSGEPAVFVHGLGGSATNWTDLMGELLPDCNSIALDLPGFGQSPPPRDGDYSPAGHARAVEALIEAEFGQQPVHLFGNSMGGAIAVQLAARRSDLVRSLTLVSPAMPERRPRSTNVHLPVIAIPGVGTQMMKKYLTLESGRRAQATVDLCFADPSRVSPQRLQEMLTEVAARESQTYVADAFLGSLRGLMGSYLETGESRPWKLAEQIVAPTLVVYGRQDKLVNSKAAHSVTKIFPNAHVALLNDCGHVAQMEHPEEVALLWRRLLHH
jgi:hypothetical protein